MRSAESEAMKAWLEMPVNFPAEFQAVYDSTPHGLPDILLRR
jgi:hypothetical protein